MEPAPWPGLWKYRLRDQHRQMGQVDQALYFYRQALSLNPLELKIRRHLVVAYKKAGKLDEALQELKRMVRTNPADASAYVEMGRFYLLREDRSGARGVLSRGPEDLPAEFSCAPGAAKAKIEYPYPRMLR